MERVSFNLVALAGVAIIFMLCTATTPVLGRAETTSDEETPLPVRYEKLLEKMAAMRRVQPSIYQTGLKNPKMKMISQPTNNILEVFESSMEKDLQCVGQGSYCNAVYGPQCCYNNWACIPPGLVGGVCGLIKMNN